MKKTNQHLKKILGFPVWKKNYYEHIIRNENYLNNIIKYIRNNPENLGKDNLFQL